MTILVVFALVALGCLVLLIRGRDRLRTFRWHGGQFGLTAAAVLIVGGLVHDFTLTDGPRWIQVVVVAVVIGLTIAHMATTVHGHQPFRPFLAFIPMLLAFYMFILTGLQAVDSDVFARLAPVLLWACLGILLAAGAVPLRSLLRVIVAVTCVISMLLPLLPRPYSPCTSFKCSLFGDLLLGPFTSANYLGQLAALTMLIGAFSFRGALRVSVMVLSTLLLIATESRTSQIAAAGGLFLGWVIITITTNSGRNISVRTVTALAWSATLMCAGVGCYLIYNLTDGDFSNRTSIWARGVRVLGDNWLTGLGGEAWSVAQASGALPQLFPHSQYLMMLFWGGVIGVAAYTAMMAVTVSRAARIPEVLPLAAAVVGYMLTLGMTEAFWNPAGVDGHSFFMLIILVIAYHSPITTASDVLSPPPSKGGEAAVEPAVRVVRSSSSRHARALLEPAAES